MAGLAALADVHLRMADDPAAFAAQVVEAAELAARGEDDRRVDAAEGLATTTYHPDAVRRRAARLLQAATAPTALPPR
jgi:hypothetical protein